MKKLFHYKHSFSPEFDFEVFDCGMGLSVRVGRIFFYKDWLRKVIYLWYDIKEQYLKNSAHFTNILTQHTSIENNKNNENHQISVLFDVFLHTY